MHPRWREILLAVVIATSWVALVRPGPVSLPYFWDEADVYVPGACWLAENGLDIRPGVFPDDYSRGHPQLLYLVAGVAFRLFGPGPSVGHMVALPFAVLALAGIYLLGAMVFGRLAGAAAAALMATTPMFMSIGNMLLPEVPLTALTVLALVFFVRGHMLGVILAGSALVLIKETGVFTPLAIGGGLLWDAWRRSSLGERRTWSRLALSMIPVVVLGAFFVWQKVAAGYFIFPHHQDMFWDRPFGPGDLLTVFPSLLLWHGRWLVLGAAALWLVALRLTRTPQAGTVGAGEELPGEDLLEPWRPRPTAVVVAMGLLVLANAVFFSKMFWLDRYGLPAHPGLLLLASGVLLGGVAASRSPAERWLKWVRAAPIAATVVAGFVGLWAATAPDEEELTFAYADVVATHQRACGAIGEREGDPLVLTFWPMTVELRHPYLGYVERPVRTLHADQAGEDHVDLVLLATRSRHADALRERAAAAGMRLADEFRIGRAQALELWAP